MTAAAMIVAQFLWLPTICLVWWAWHRDSKYPIHYAWVRDPDTDQLVRARWNPEAEKYELDWWNNPDVYDYELDWYKNPASS